MNVNAAKCRITAHSGLAPVAEMSALSGRVSAPPLQHLLLDRASMAKSSGFMRRYSYNVGMQELEEGRVRSALRGLRRAEEASSDAGSVFGSRAPSTSRLVKSGSLNSLASNGVGP